MKKVFVTLVLLFLTGKVYANPLYCTLSKRAYSDITIRQAFVATDDNGNYPEHYVIEGYPINPLPNPHPVNFSDLRLTDVGSEVFAYPGYQSLNSLTVKVDFEAPIEFPRGERSFYRGSMEQGDLQSVFRTMEDNAGNSIKERYAYPAIDTFNTLRVNSLLIVHSDRGTRMSLSIRPENAMNYHISFSLLRNFEGEEIDWNKITVRHIPYTFRRMLSVPCHHLETN